MKANAGIQADDLDGERAAEAGKPAAERKGDRERRVDVDAETARHALVVDGGAHLGAEARVLEREGKEERDRQPRGDEKQPIGGEADAHESDRSRADRTASATGCCRVPNT